MEVPAATGGGGGTTPVTTSRSTTWNVAGVLTFVTTTRSTTWNVTAPTFAGAYPASISGRKLLDQNGRQHIMFLMQSWAMAANLSNAEITTALNAVAAMGFTGVNVDPLGAVFIGGQSGWHQFTNKAGQGFFTGTPFQTSLGPAMASTDWIVQETARLGLTCSLCLFGGYSTDGGRASWVAATNTQMFNTGAAIATRYQSYQHIIWELELDWTTVVTDTDGVRAEAYFQGINSVEGASRPVRWCEPLQGNSPYSQGWINTPQAKVTLNAMYSYNVTAVEDFDSRYTEVTTVPIGDCEPPYDSSGHYTGDVGQQLRERTASVFIRGGVFMAWGHENWWTFGAGNPLNTEGLTWTDIPTHAHALQQGYIVQMLTRLAEDSTWAPSSKVTTGVGSGDNKAAVGASSTALLAYFPTSRTIVVDTTGLGAGSVRLRWFDPTNNTYTSIATSEAQTASRSVSYPGNNSAGSTDWMLVVDQPAVTATRSTTWNTALSVTASRGTTWNTLAPLAAAATRGTTWNVAGSAVNVTASRSTTWVVLAQTATASRTTTWTTLFKLTSPSTVTTSWATPLLGDQCRATTWQVLNPIAAPGSQDHIVGHALHRHPNPGIDVGHAGCRHAGGDPNYNMGHRDDGDGRTAHFLERCGEPGLRHHQSHDVVGHPSICCTGLQDNQLGGADAGFSDPFDHLVHLDLGRSGQPGDDVGRHRSSGCLQVHHLERRWLAVLHSGELHHPLGDQGDRQRQQGHHVVHAGADRGVAGDDMGRPQQDSPNVSDHTVEGCCALLPGHRQPDHALERCAGSAVAPLPDALPRHRDVLRQSPGLGPLPGVHHGLAIGGLRGQREV